MAAERVRWWKNGDHPEDEVEAIVGDDGISRLTPGKVVRPYEAEPGQENTLCTVCSAPFSIHGVVEGAGIVHPGDFVVTEDGERSVVHPDPMAAALAAAEAAAPPPPTPGEVEPEPAGRVPVAGETAEA